MSPVKSSGDTPTNPDSSSPVCSSLELLEATPTDVDAAGREGDDGVHGVTNGATSSKDSPATPKSDPASKPKETRFQVVRGKPRRLSRKFSAASESAVEVALSSSSEKTVPVCNGFHPLPQTATQERAVLAPCNENHPPGRQPSSMQRKTEGIGQRGLIHKSPSPPPPAHTTATKTAWHNTPTRCIPLYMYMYMYILYNHMDSSYTSISNVL